MREYIKKSENQSRTLGNNPKASNQARVSDILQASDTSGRKTSPKAVTKLGNTIQRILLIDGATYTDDNGDAGLKTLIDDSRVWKFRTLNEAKSVGKLVKTMEKALSTENDMEHDRTKSILNLNLYKTLAHFRDPDHPVPPSSGSQGLDSKGKYSEVFSIKNTQPYEETLKTLDVKDDAPKTKRTNEALITAIKLESMTDIEREHRLYGSQAVDYVLEVKDRKKQYGFDPFELPKDLISLEKELNTWLENVYEDHVRTKKVNVGIRGEKAYYSGLLDISSLNVDQLNFLLNAIYDYEQRKLLRSVNYEVPHFSLVNPLLTENNVADFEFPQEFDVLSLALDDIFNEY